VLKLVEKLATTATATATPPGEGKKTPQTSSAPPAEAPSKAETMAVDGPAGEPEAEQLEAMWVEHVKTTANLANASPEELGKKKAMWFGINKAKRAKTAAGSSQGP
jgi:hypothetical protein